MNYSAIKLIFTRDDDDFINKLFNLIKPNLEFHIIFDSVDFNFFEEISFDNNEVDLIFQVHDMEYNYGLCTCTFEKNLKNVNLCFMYEDGNEYNKLGI